MIRIRGIKTKIEEKTEEDLKKIVKKKYHCLLYTSDAADEL